MSNEIKNEAGRQPSIDLGNVVFDESGEISGLDDDLLENISGGLKDPEVINFCCPEC